MRSRVASSSASSVVVPPSVSANNASSAVASRLAQLSQATSGDLYLSTPMKSPKNAIARLRYLSSGRQARYERAFRASRLHAPMCARSQTGSRGRADDQAEHGSSSSGEQEMPC